MRLVCPRSEAVRVAHSAIRAGVSLGLLFVGVSPRQACEEFTFSGDLIPTYALLYVRLSDCRK